ncbi:hypothetical protein ACLOJK_028111, partial [Asimina triloba]
MASYDPNPNPNPDSSPQTLEEVVVERFGSLFVDDPQTSDANGSLGGPNYGHQIKEEVADGSIPAGVVEEVLESSSGMAWRQNSEHEVEPAPSSPSSSGYAGERGSSSGGSSGGIEEISDGGTLGRDSVEDIGSASWVPGKRHLDEVRDPGDRVKFVRAGKHQRHFSDPAGMAVLLPLTVSFAENLVGPVGSSDFDVIYFRAIGVWRWNRKEEYGGGGNERREKIQKGKAKEDVMAVVWHKILIAKGLPETKNGGVITEKGKAKEDVMAVLWHKILIAKGLPETKNGGVITERDRGIRARVEPSKAKQRLQDPNEENMPESNKETELSRKQKHTLMIFWFQVIFLVKGPIYLVCISCTEEPYEALRGQLELIYGQMILILTKSINRCFEKNPKFDMTPLLGGTDVVFSSLIHAFSWYPMNPATFLHAYTCLPLAYPTRQAAGAILQDVADSGVLFAILMCKHKVISLVGAQKASLHPDDMLLLANFVDTYLMLLTTSSEAFYHLKDC